MISIIRLTDGTTLRVEGAIMFDSTLPSLRVEAETGTHILNPNHVVSIKEQA